MKLRLALTSIIVFLGSLANSQAAEPDYIAVFESGRDGYHTYRIPALILTKKGTFLAFCEGRRKGRSDAGDIDLLLKRSEDGGRTWSKAQTVWEDGANTCGNPCPVVDQRDGTIHLLMTHNLGEDAEPKIVGGTSKGSRTVWHSISTDDGLTWSKPIEKTASVKKPDWNWYATGPGVGIQTRTGRLIIPCDNKSGPGGKLRQSHVIYSDDRGKTWKLGGVIGPKCNESQIVELADGSLLINMRSYDANKVRFTALSKDGGATFTSPIEDQALIEPVCQASIIRIPGEGNGVLFCNPASRKRENLTVRLSDDGGTTWKHARTVYAGPAAYSCLAALPDGTFACLFECGEKDAYQSIKLARFTRWWVEGR